MTSATAKLTTDFSKEELAQIKADFNEADKDGSGTIDRAELKTIVQKSFPELPDELLEQYVNNQMRADTDFSGSLSWREYLVLCRSMRKTRKLPPVKLAPIKK